MSFRAVAVVVAIATACVAGAQTLVRDVSVRVLDQFGTDATDVLSFCSVKAGQELSQETLSRDVRALLDTGRYGYAAVELVNADNGVNVIFVVKRRYRYQEPLAIKRTSHLSERKIRKLAELKSGDYIDEPVLSSKAGKIRDEYIKKFFPDVQIGASIQPIEGSAGAANITFTIDEGARARIKKFRFTGNTVIPQEKLRASFGHRPWYDPRGWFRDTPVSAQDLEDARQMAEDLYKDAGYLDARVAPPVKQQLDKDKVEMVFAVTEGDVYTVESTAIRGVKLFPEREVLAAGRRLAVDAVAGQQAIDDAAKDIRDYYGARGYVDTFVRPVKETIPGKPGRMAITYEVREGELVYIRNIVIRGNNKTRDKVIRREIMVNPGEIMNEPRIERSENRLKNLQYFKTVRHYNEESGQPGVRDLVYEVEEQRTGNFMIGVGVGSVENVIGFLEITQSNFDILNWPNFTGGGQKARFGAEFGPRRQTAEVSWTEPWLFDRPLALTLEAYRRMRWQDQYDEIRTGGSAGLSYPIKFGRFGMRYTLEMVEMDDVSKGEWYANPDGDTIKELEKYEDKSDWAADNRYFRWQKSEYSDNLNSVVRIYWAHDTRDHAFIPTRGYRANVFGEAAEGGIGDNEFYKFGASFRQWFPMPWYKNVLSLSGRLETVDDYGNNDVPIYERLFLGGPRTVRGVEYRDIGPKVFREGRKSHAPIGGKSLAQATAEYTIPIFKALRFATFMDVGTIDSDSFKLGSDVSVTAGVGLRIDIPSFPMRFDFAKPISDDDRYTNEEVFSFSVGFDY